MNPRHAFLMINGKKVVNSFTAKVDLRPKSVIVLQQIGMKETIKTHEDLILDMEFDQYYDSLMFGCIYNVESLTVQCN